MRHLVSLVLLSLAVVFLPAGGASGDMTVGSVTVTPADSAVWVTAPYTGDTDSNNTLKIFWKASSEATWPGTPQYSLPHSSSPYVQKITGLVNGESYDVRVEFVDSPVSGTNPLDFLRVIPSGLMHNSYNATMGTRKWDTQGGWGIQGGQYGEFRCETCHQRRAPNIKRVTGSVTAPSGSFPGGAVVFQSTDGFGDDSDGHTTSSRVCEVCHSQTDVHRYNTTGQTVKTHYNNTNCTEQCHRHRNGFGHGGSGTSSACIECHGHDAGYEYSAGRFSQGKGTFRSHSTHTENDGDDLKGPNISCDACHDAGNMPYFRSGTDTDGDGRYSLSETDVCNACHSPGGTYNGVGDAVIGAKSNWKTGVYEADGKTLQAGRERWCAGCHDESPSVIDGIAAPNVVGNESGPYAYGAGWGYYKTGHGLPSSQRYPASGGVTAGAGKGCDSCHDFATSHTDGLARTFDDQESDSLDPSYYRTGYRLNMVAAGEGTGATGREPMLVPVPGTAANSANNYRLCVSCHASGPFVNNADMNTNFRTKWSTIDPELNRHEYHLRSTGVGKRVSSDWSNAACTGGDSSQCNSRMTCTTCHDVHGSARLAMVRDGRLIGREPGLKIWYYNDGLTSYTSPPDTAPTPQNVPLSASTGTVWSGGSSGNLCSHCHGNNNLTTELRTPYQDVQQAPVLSWTGESGYTSDGVSPDTSAAESGFTFRVRYTDANNEEPAVIEVWVDVDDNGTYDAGEKFGMGAVDPADSNYTDGRLYTKTLILSKAGDNTFSYRFHASNSLVATGDPTSDMTVSVTNNAPALAWTGEPDYVSDGVNPDTGGNGAAFEFRVKYTDLDNEAPASMQVWVDRNDNGSYEADEKFDLAAADPGDTVYADGKLYSGTINLSYAGDGDLNYRFHASDGTADATGGPASDSVVRVQPSSNTPPTLGWTTAACLTNGIRPARGATGADFEFLVGYTDADNQAPAPIQVWVDANDNGTYEPGEKFDMTETDPGDRTYSDGKLYRYSGPVSHAGDGVLTYRFYATDGTDPASGAPASDSMLTVVNTSLKVRPAGGSGWYDDISDAVAASSDPSTILVYPNSDFTAATYSGGLSFSGRPNRTLQSVCGRDLTVISGGANVITIGSTNVTVDGFTVTGGTTYGVYFDSASAISGVIRNSRIDSNATGVYMNRNSTINIEDSSVRFNTVRGINSAQVTDLLSVRRCDISSNNAGANPGAGVSISGGSGAHIMEDSVVSENITTGNGGGIYLINGGRLDIRRSTINGNTAANGGAIYSNNSTPVVTITDTYIQGNSASQAGGGIYINTGYADLTNVIMTGNRAGTTGGAVFENSYMNCLFCTISGNYAGNLGGALYHNSTAATSVRNSILYKNDALNQPNYKEIYAVGGRWQYVDVYSTLIDQIPGSATYTYGYESISGNLHEGSRTNELPYFVGGLEPSSSPTVSGDYRICGGTDDPPGSGCINTSSCIDAGNSGYASDHDIFGGTRPLGGGYDMGVHEKE